MSDFNLDTLLSQGFVKKSYVIIPGKLDVEFRSLVNRESLEIRKKLIDKQEKDPLFAWNYEFMLHQITRIGEHTIESPEQAREILDRYPTPVVDRILNAYVQFAQDVDKLLGEPPNASQGTSG